MEYLCLGAYIRIFEYYADSSLQSLIECCEQLLLALYDGESNSFHYIDKNGEEAGVYHDTFKKISECKQNIRSDIINMAKKKNRYDLQRYFKELVNKYFSDESHKKYIILALKHLILNDSSIGDLQRIGDITKNELRTESDFDLPKFLSDVFFYAITQTKNRKGESFISEIDDDYFEQFKNSSEYIKINISEEIKPNTETLIPLTSKGTIDAVCDHLKTLKLDPPVKNEIQIFSLRLNNYNFDFNALLALLRNNIGYYLYSRLLIKSFKDTDTESTIALDAIADYEKILQNNNTLDNELGELLLYIFLEQYLHAPKIMSSIELDKCGLIKRSESAGMFLISPNQRCWLNQIILGVAMIDGDLETAIVNVLLNIKHLKDRRNPRQIVDSAIFKSYFSEENYKKIKSLISPTEKSRQNAATGFGIFLEYSLTPVAGKDTEPIDTYQEKVKKQIIEDVKNKKDHINAKIEEFGLGGFPIYIYLLPFEDADKNKKDFINKLLHSGGRY